MRGVSVPVLLVRLVGGMTEASEVAEVCHGSPSLPTCLEIARRKC